MDSHTLTRNGTVYYIPERMMPGIDRYVNHKVRPGDFLQAIICNDLKLACLFADDENIKNLPAYVDYFYNEVPANCWGSEMAMLDWLEGRTE